MSSSLRHTSLRRLAAILLTLPGLLLPTAAMAAPPPDSHHVIVEAADSAAAADAVDRVGGRVDATLDLVGAVAARVSDPGLAVLTANPSVRVTPDVVLESTGASFDPASAPLQLSALDPGDEWSLQAGAGVGVGLVDTGVSVTPDLPASRIVNGPDLSGEGDGVDRYGHGTFMAGLIAGDGTASAGGPVRYTGAAPGATVVSVKVAGADGSTTLSRVIAAIGWIVVNSEEHNTRVLSLSFGVDAGLPYLENPLSAAVEAAWSAGITVVASSGNEGAGHVTSPGSDPWIVTVGATDTMGTADVSDDVVPDWSSSQDFRKYAKPEVVAPGVSVVSQRVPGSTIDQEYAAARVDDHYFSGSGTSMATALVAGAAAVLTERHPMATPDDIKGALIDGAGTVADGATRAVSIEGADAAEPRPGWWQRFGIAFNGLGIGLRDRMPWASGRWDATRWGATRWGATRWGATRWGATRWGATRWGATRWGATRWGATRWGATRWGATRWGATRWGASRWGATRWAAGSWNGAT